MIGVRPTQLSSAVITGVAVGIAVGMLLTDQDPASLAAFALVSLVLFFATRSIAPAPSTGLLLTVALAFSLRAAAAALLYNGSLAIGRGGFISGDDADYAVLAWKFVLFLSGQGEAPWVPPFWNGNTYLFGTYVYLESFVFALVGPNVVTFEMLNAGFGTLVVVLTYDIARRVFDERAGILAATLTAVYPSLVLWSAMNLKDSLSLAIIMVAIWAVVRFQDRPRWTWLLLAFALLLPMESLRRYVFLALAIVIPASVAVAPHLHLRARAVWAMAALAISVFFTTGLPSAAGNTITSQVMSSEAAGTLEVLEYSRHAMAAGARTGFHDDLLSVKEGDTFVVQAPSPVPTRTPTSQVATPQPEPEPTPTPRVVHVDTDTRIVVVARTAGPPSPAPREVVVQPGDIVIVGRPQGTPSAAIRVLTESTQLKPVTREDVVPRTLNYLPKGLTYALFAPFPWSLGRALDVLTVPEMLAWYLLLGAAAATVWRHRQRWRVLLPLFLFVLEIVFILALAEGNWGTLFRHRSMIIPAVVVLAAPELLRRSSEMYPVIARRRPVAR